MEKDKLAKIFGEQLRRRRELFGISQEKLALLSDVDRTYVSKIERGIRQPTLFIIFKLCQTLEVEPEKFIHSVRLEYCRCE